MKDWRKREEEAMLLARHPMRGRSTSDEEIEEREATQESVTRGEGEGAGEQRGKRHCNRPARYMV